MVHEEESQSDYKRPAVADEAVHPPPATERIRAGAVVEDEEDVDGHGQRPPGIGLHEPVG